MVGHTMTAQAPPEPKQVEPVPKFKAVIPSGKCGMKYLAVY